MDPREERAQLLKFIAFRSAKDRPTTTKDLVYSLGLSIEGAAGRLLTLWRHRLITSYTIRRARYGFRLLPGEQVSDLRFRLSARGRQWLRWYERQDEESG